MRHLIVLCSALLLVSCAPPLDSSDMRPMASVIQQIPENKELERNIGLGDVVVPEAYASSGIGTFSAKEFRDALVEGLLSANFIARNGKTPAYTLSAEFIELDQPAFGFSMDASSRAKYTLTRTSDHKVVYDDTIGQTYHAAFGEAFSGNERARIASSKAIRENITHLIRVLAELDSKQLKGN